MLQRYLIELAVKLRSYEINYENFVFQAPLFIPLNRHCSGSQTAAGNSFVVPLEAVLGIQPKPTITIIMLVAIWLVIYLKFRPRERWADLDASHFRKQYRALGPSTPEQKIVFILFILLAMLWIFRTGIKFDSFTIPGWSSLFGNPEYFNDGTVAIFISALLFIFPAPRRKRERIMDMKTLKKLPWHIILLFGGGFALALAFQSSGLALWFGQQLEWTGQVPPFLIMLSVVTLMSFLTELTTNIASTQMLLPVFAGLAVSCGNNPMLFMIPATLASSLAFTER